MTPLMGSLRCATETLLSVSMGLLLIWVRLLKRFLGWSDSSNQPSKTCACFALVDWGQKIFKDLQRTRLRLRFSNFTGDAKKSEQWAIGRRRLGGVATKHIYEQYAAQRWGRASTNSRIHWLGITFIFSKKAITVRLVELKPVPTKCSWPKFINKSTG